MDAQSDCGIKASVPSVHLYFRDIFDAISLVKLLVDWHGQAKLTMYWQVVLSKAFSPVRCL